MSDSPARRVLVIGWDAADWQVIHPLLDAGLMPNSRSGSSTTGTMGNLASLSPMLSPMLWTSIATGKRAYAHGVRWFAEPLPDHSGVRPVGTRSRRCKALWNIVSQSDRPALFAGGRQVIRPSRFAERWSRICLRAAGEFATANNGRFPKGVSSRRAGREIWLNFASIPSKIEAPTLQQLIPRAAELDQIRSHRSGTGLTFFASGLPR